MRWCTPSATAARRRSCAARWPAGRCATPPSGWRGGASPSLGLEVDDDCWVQLAQRPLATVFRSELEALVRDAPRGWRASGAFLWFRLAEEDLNDAVADGTPLLLCDGAGAVEWLHDQRGLDDAYSAARRASTGDVDLEELRLQTHATLWHDATDAHLAYARHLALHPRWGRPFDARTRQATFTGPSLTRARPSSTRTVGRRGSCCGTTPWAIAAAAGGDAACASTTRSSGCEVGSFFARAKDEETILGDLLFTTFHGSFALSWTLSSYSSSFHWDFITTRADRPVSTPAVFLHAFKSTREPNSSYAGAWRGAGRSTGRRASRRRSAPGSWGIR